MNRDFADHFRRLVVPKLERIARTQGFFLALDLVDYAGAHAAVWDIAVRLGGARLRDDMIHDIREWIGDEIWRAFERADADIQEYREKVSDPVWRDIQQWERKLARYLRQQGSATCQTKTAA